MGRKAERPAMTRPSAAAPMLMNMYVGLTSKALMARGIRFKSVSFEDSSDAVLASVIV